MRREELQGILRNGEGQTVEFKTYLAEQEVAIQTMVAFANSHDGKLFYGVRDDGTVVGVDTGSNTLENLATAIRDHTYPSLPIDSVDEIDYDGNKIVMVEVPKDVPLIVGVYLYSATPITSDKPVDASKLQAYRRVGRTTLKEDFMRLRQVLSSDSRLRVGLHVGRSNPGIRAGARAVFPAFIWAEEGSAIAHDVKLFIDPPICYCPNSYADLPYRTGGASSSVLLMDGEASFMCEALPTPLPGSLRMIATYKDDYGLTWECSRKLDTVADPAGSLDLFYLRDGGEFRRRIGMFPPKPV